MRAKTNKMMRKEEDVPKGKKEITGGEGTDDYELARLRKPGLKEDDSARGDEHKKVLDKARRDGRESGPTGALQKIVGAELKKSLRPKPQGQVTKGYHFHKTKGKAKSYSGRNGMPPTRSKRKQKNRR